MAASTAFATGADEGRSLTVEVKMTNLGKKKGLQNIRTGICFLDHMLDQICSHAQLGLEVVVCRAGTPAAPETNATPATDSSDGKRSTGTEGEVPDDAAIVELVGSGLGRALRALFTTVTTSSGGTTAVGPAARFLAPLDEALCEAIITPQDGSVAGFLSFGLAPYGSVPKG